ncbi:unnamed protein product, partial [Symbiodinium microadriaticum]
SEEGAPPDLAGADPDGREVEGFDDESEGARDKDGNVPSEGEAGTDSEFKHTVAGGTVSTVDDKPKDTEVNDCSVSKEGQVGKELDNSAKLASQVQGSPVNETASDFDLG